MEESLSMRISGGMGRYPGIKYFIVWSGILGAMMGNCEQEWPLFLCRNVDAVPRFATLPL